MKKVLQGNALAEKAKKLGVCDDVEFLITQGTKVSEAELQRRVIEAERSLRESRLWIVALVSAIASALSAAAAIIVALSIK